MHESGEQEQLELDLSSGPGPEPAPGHISVTSRAVTPEQKAEVLEALRRAWLARPDLRLGQLIAVWARTAFSNPGHGPMFRDREELDGLFYVEDGDAAHSLILWAASGSERR